MTSSILDRVVAATPANFTDFGYLTHNIDVADAHRSGAVSSPREHFRSFGKSEGRAILQLKTAADFLEAGDILARQGELYASLDAYRIAAGKAPGQRDAVAQKTAALQSSVEAGPDGFHFRRELAGAGAAESRGSARKQAVERWAATYPENPHAWRELAAFHIDNEEYEQALSPLLHSIELHSHQPLAWVMLAQSYLGVGKHPEALAAIDKAIGLVGISPLLRVNVVGLLIGLKLYDRALEYALGLRSNRAIPQSVRHAMMIEAIAGAGRWAEATQMLAELARRDQPLWTEVAHRACWVFVRQIERLIQARRPREALTLIDSLPEQVRNTPPPRFWRQISFLSSTALYLERHPDAALRQYARSQSMADPVLSQPILPRPEASIVTSLMPRRLDVQQAAVRSWRAFGCEVISVNSAEEIELLKPDFPDVHFAAASRDARAEFGRPLIYLDELLSALEGVSSELVGVVNSDIVFNHAPQGGLSLRDLTRLAAVGLAFGNRVNVERLGQWSGEVFLDGYDWFIFSRTMLPVFKGTDLVFGTPWWDFWLPIATLVAGYDLINVRREFAFHADHPLGWNQAAFHDMGRRLVDALAAACRSTQPRTLAALALHDLSATLALQAAGESLPKSVIGRLCQTINAIIQGEMRTLDL